MRAIKVIETSVYLWDPFVILKNMGPYSWSNGKVSIWNATKYVLSYRNDGQGNTWQWVGLSQYLCLHSFGSFRHVLFNIYIRHANLRHCLWAILWFRNGQSNYNRNVVCPSTVTRLKKARMELNHYKKLSMSSWITETWAIPWYGVTDESSR